MARLSFSHVAVWIAVIVVVVLAVLFLVVDSAFNGSPLSRWQRRVEHARTHTVLDKPLMVDGALLPAGTEITWEDHSRSHVVAARLREPAEVLGVRTAYLRREGDGEWSVVMSDARVLDGWPCAAGQIQLSAAGRLRGCALSAATPWQGWILPERTSVDPLPDIHGVRFNLPFASPLDMPLQSPVLGGLPWAIVLNEDGSPSAASYDRQAPHRVAGQEFAGDVRWEYDPATFGMGRDRPPVGVSGFVYDPGGAGMAGPRHRVTLPWPGTAAR